MTMTSNADILHDPVLLNTLDAHAGVEIHLSDTVFLQGGKVRVFWRGDEVAEGDDIRRTLVAAINRIARIRDEEERGERIAK